MLVKKDYYRQTRFLYFNKSHQNIGENKLIRDLQIYNQKTLLSLWCKEVECSRDKYLKSKLDNKYFLNKINQKVSLNKFRKKQVRKSYPSLIGCNIIYYVFIKKLKILKILAPDVDYVD